MAASRIAFDADPRRYEEKGADHVVLGVIEDLEGDSPRAPQTQEVGVAAEDLLTERIAALIMRSHAKARDHFGREFEEGVG